MQEITVQGTQAVVGGYALQGIAGVSIREGTVVSWTPLGLGGCQRRVG
ncbi:hypothetical protein [Pseudomonas fluorescens]|nr:hypothetical protein [Pseudomonas fluorescens]